MMAAPWQNRIIGSGEESPSHILANPANFRRHPEFQQDVLRGVLDQIGWIQDVIINRQTGHLIDGHLRVELALKDGQPFVPVKYVDLSPNDEALALATLDPISALAYHDDTAINDLLNQIEADDVHVQEFLASLIAEIPNDDVEGMTDPDDVPEPPADPITKPGDIWTLGSHMVGCIDSTDVQSVIRLIGDRSFDLLMIDPPYGIDAPKMTLGKGKRQFHRGDWDGSRIDVLPFLDLTTHACIWGGNYYADALPITNDWLAWHKKIDGGNFSEFELAWTNYGCNTRLLSHHWSGETKEHPTQKPVDVIRWAIDKAPMNGSVLDLFGGSGTTLIACEQSGRICVLADNDPVYVDVAVARWERFTGKTAVLSQESQEQAAD